MGIRYTTDDFIKKAIEVHDGKYDYSQVIYKTSRDKVIIICPKHGAFSQQAASHLAGCGCPGCQKEWSDAHRKNHAESARKSRGMTTEDWISRAKAVHGDRYDYSRVVYVNQRTDVAIICRKHGLFLQKADSHIRGCGCRLCGYDEGAAKFSHTWSDEQREKIAETCLQRYGARRYLDSADGKAKMALIQSDIEFRKKMSVINSSEEVQAKIRATSMAKYGVDCVGKLKEVHDKADETRRRNGTWSTSKPEEKMYTFLCDVFGIDDVVRQYKESRYPFHCDFYLKSLDLFIELNATWIHGGHWFDVNNVDDIATLDFWRQKVLDGHRFYGVAIDVWSVRDVKKLQTALNNRLNYLVFWDNNLFDFLDWLNSDRSILNNIT